MNRQSVVRAFLVAPLVAPIVVWMIAIVESVLAGRATANGAWGAVSAGWNSFALAFVLGGPVAYAATLLVGLPGWFIARRWDVVSRSYTVAMGAVTGGCVGWLLAPPPHKDELVSIPITPWSAAFAGAGVAFVWFVLAFRVPESSERRA